VTGNDIVDLQVAAMESNWRRKGFLEKLFTPAEQDSILGSANPDETVWHMWSMKESTYKIHNRLSGERSFAPVSFECIVLGDSDGRVIHGNETYRTRTLITTRYLYTIACSAEQHRPDHLGKCFMLTQASEPHRHAFIEHELIGHYALFSGIPADELALKKDGRGIPYLFCIHIQRQIPVSVTHHGNYAAFTIN